MTHKFYEEDLNDKEGKKVRTVLRFVHDNGFDGEATAEHKKEYWVELQQFLDSKDPKKVAEAKAKLIKQKKDELAELEGKDK